MVIDSSLVSLVVLAAGLSTRYGRLKQLASIGPSGEALLDYSLYDAHRVGIERVVLVIREELEAEFRRHLDRRWRDRLTLEYVHQRLNDVPPGIAISGERVKPWGTGHAVLAAAPTVTGPFIVCNADDFYGRQAYTALTGHARNAENELAVAAYPLEDTLSASGAVSRGLLTVQAGLVTRVEEVRGLRRAGRVVRGLGVDGTAHLLTGREPVSTNLWMFVPAFCDTLRDAFAEFLAEHSRAPDAEFLIGAAVNRWIRSGGALHAVPVASPWLGITHPGDTAGVQARLGALVAAGVYPTDVGRART